MDAKDPAAWVVNTLDDGMTYYYNKVNRKIVWDKPILLCKSWEEIQLSR